MNWDELTQGAVDLVEQLPCVLLIGVHLCPCNCICNCSSVHSVRSSVSQIQVFCDGLLHIHHHQCRVCDRRVIAREL